MSKKPAVLTDAALRNLDDAAFAGEVNGQLWVASRYFAGPVTGDVGRYWRAHAAKCAPVGPESPVHGAKISLAHYSADGGPELDKIIPAAFDEAPLEVYRLGSGDGAPLCVARPAAEGVGVQVLLTSGESAEPVCSVNLRMLAAVVGVDELGALDALTLPRHKLSGGFDVTLHAADKPFTKDGSRFLRALHVKRWSTAVRADTHKTEVYGSVAGIVMPCRIKTGG